MAIILAEMGHDDRTIADMLGQKTLAMAQHYSDKANRSRKFAPVIKDFDAEMNSRRTKFVKPLHTTKTERVFNMIIQCVNLAGDPGFEPGPTESESAVLPLY